MATSIRGPTTPTTALDRYTRLVGRVLNVPAACISLIDAEGWLTTSSYGMPPPNAMLVAWSFLKRTDASGRPLVVEDGRRDLRVARLPAVSEGTVASYVGMRLVAPDGRVVGTLSAMDEKPRRWTARHLAFLQQVRLVLLAERDEGASAGDMLDDAAVHMEAVP